MGDLVLKAEVGYLLAGKFCPVVRDNSIGESKATHDVLPKKLDNLLTNDFEEWHRFNPFGEIVSSY